MSHLTFSGTIVCLTTLNAIQHCITNSLIAGETALCIAAEANLRDGLHLFVFLIQAFAWNSLPKEAHERVLIAFA